MSDDERPTGEVIVMRNPANRPVAVPDEVVTEAEREYRAFKARRSGMTWDEIAVREGYPNGSAASAAVKRYLDEGKAVVGEFRRVEAIAMEVASLDALQRAFWDAAMAGDTKAGTMVLNTITTRIRLTKLDQVLREDEDAANAPRTVVVAAGSYVDDLRAIAES